MTQTAYLAPEGFEADLQTEIERYQDLRILQRFGRLFLVQGPEKSLVFAQNTWRNVRTQNVASISLAAKALKEHGKFWALYSHTLHRRMSLIQDQLPKLYSAEQVFPQPAPARRLGAWTLADETTLIFSPDTDSVFPLGEVNFQETKAAPSRAYLKLWEFFTLTGRFPQRGEVCLDLGSSPGGWTWVLAQLGCQVISVDKAPLAPELLKNLRIRSIRKDAFSLDPKEIGPVDWLFSDIICYPNKLYELVQNWRQNGRVRNMVCTIKFQGKTDFEALQAFQNLPGSQIRHLFVNKHEVTWSSLETRLDNRPSL